MGNLNIMSFKPSFGSFLGMLLIPKEIVGSQNCGRDWASFFDFIELLDARKGGGAAYHWTILADGILDEFKPYKVG